MVSIPTFAYSFPCAKKPIITPLRESPYFGNLRAFAKELRYTREDIKKIIDNNILNEFPSKLVDKNNKDPVHAFVGIDNEYISNSGTGKQEPLMDYWLRHCTLRPRDAVLIGQEISKIKPERRDKRTVRSAINAAAAERVQTLFAEVMPFFDGLFPNLFPKVLDSNVMSSDELDSASQNYARMVGEEEAIVSKSALHPFCTLYAIGLLGVVGEDRDRPGTLIQRFAPVGQVPFGSIGVLPKADKYVIHPSLTDYIQSKNVGFLRKTNRQNVIGDFLEWRNEQDIRFVAIGDMRGYRATVMSNVGASQTFAAFWSESFRAFTLNVDYAVSSGGDSVLIADRSLTRLLRILRNLMITLRDSNYAMQFRFGLHSGFWRLNQDEEGVAHPEIADIVGVAARIEPFARPGDILISETAMTHARRIGLDLVREGVGPVPHSYFPEGTRIRPKWVF